MLGGERMIRPKHYDECSLECIDAMIILFGYEETVSFCEMNAFKYLWRHKNKGGLEDLEKAKTYLGMAKEIAGKAGSDVAHDLDVGRMLRMDKTIQKYKENITE